MGLYRREGISPVAVTVVCELPSAEDTVSVAVEVVAPTGVKVRFTEQFWDGARLGPQLLFSEKTSASAPLRLTELIASAVFPVLINPKLSVEGAPCTIESGMVSDGGAVGLTVAPLEL